MIRFLLFTVRTVLFSHGCEAQAQTVLLQCCLKFELMVDISPSHFGLLYACLLALQRFIDCYVCSSLSYWIPSRTHPLPFLSLFLCSIPPVPQVLRPNGIRFWHTTRIGKLAGFLVAFPLLAGSPNVQSVTFSQPGAHSSFDALV